MFFVSSKIWLVNIVLAALIVIFGLLNVDVWTGKGHTVSDRSAVADLKKHPPARKLINRITPPAVNYDIVAEKNLFSPDRTSPSPDESGSVRSEIPEQKIFLYGIVKMAAQKQALVNHPLVGDAPGTRGQTTDTWVKVGDTIGNLKIVQIGEEKVVLVDGEKKYEIFLYDENKPARRQNPVARPPAAPTVVVTGAEPKAPVPVAAGRTSSPPSKSAPDDRRKKKQVTEDGYEIVETPFGPFKRRIK